jgi:uncharacterized protein
MRKLIVSHQNMILSDNVTLANTFFTKLMGFMFKPRPIDNAGILFKTNSIQTHFMRFDLDVVFLTKDYKVVRIIRGLKPWRITRFHFRAKYTLELPSGSLPVELTVGDCLEVKDV